MSLLKCHRCLSTVEIRSTFTSSIQGLFRKRERVPLSQAFKDGLDNRRGCYSPSLITWKISASRSTYFHKDSRMVSSTGGGCFCPAQKRNSFANEFLFLKHSRNVTSTEGGNFCPAQKGTPSRTSSSFCPKIMGLGHDLCLILHEEELGEEGGEKKGVRS
jgi:hypothetical protein